ncbi:MAG: adenylate/guanylate cyclase domain-containing protein [Actinomycetota bacterium]|nr:adenylate/guanylate cyclase domain-containing protein [Actinomycetota bacterium]
MAESAATFVFADIAGFTALTEAHGDEEAVALVGRFADGVAAELPAVQGEHVKTIGDALMLRIPEPADAILLGVRIVGGIFEGHGGPAVRVGLHHGAAVERDGDYFGAAVNLAARVSAVAAGGEVLVSGGRRPRSRRTSQASCTSLEDATSSETSASRSSCSPPSLSGPRRIDSPSTPSAGWRSIRSVHLAGCSTTGRRTSSARSPAPGTSRGSPSASPREPSAGR